MDEFIKRYPNNDAKYALELNKNLVEDGQCRRGTGCLVNHSKNPNSKFSVDNINKRASLKALKTIRNDQEIFVNYGRYYKI